MLIVDLDNASQATNIPDEPSFYLWVKQALEAIDAGEDKEISIRIVEPAESQQLNKDYRDKDKATNVLSFPCELPDGVDCKLIGDLVICAEVVKNEAEDQDKTLQAHWAHMVVHGTLHLMGFDHEIDDEAEKMEDLETQILESLGFARPYETTENEN